MEEYLMKNVPSTAFDIGNALNVVARPLRTKSVLGLPLVSEPPAQVIDTLLSRGKRRVFFLNAHCANVRARNPSYAAALDRADYVLPDGVGVDISAKMQGKTLAANLNGTDLVPTLLEHAATKGLSVFLIGSRPGTADAAARNLCRTIPGLRIVGTRDGYDGARDTNAAVAEINASGADIVLVALGVPLQELWIDQNFHRLSARLVMGVGALFDFLAGNVKRAPAAVRRARLEWAWRLAMEPRRLAKRYLAGNAAFLARSAIFAMKQSNLASVNKRALDIVVASSAILLLSPVLIGALALIRLDSRGSAIFRQIRVGQDGRNFEIYKFRSMHARAEEERSQILKSSDRQGLCFKAKADNRITRVGKFLRRWSLDELPQLFNVLKGDMSIVGPRPALPEEVAAYPKRALGRLVAKPGITGLWQVSGRADVGFDKMVDLDLAYVRARSTLLDFMLIALTFRAVFSARGAY
jgi:exopolysaccharide biosynthesis WecB/TagA/CpsF family protein